MLEMFTIGYEGSTPDDFDRELVRHGVTLVADVRAIAASRRRGFAKTALRQRLAGQDIGYIHLRDLGDPKAGREAARAGRVNEFRRIFATHLATAVATAALVELESLILAERVALLCFEASARHCHRSLIAQKLATRRELVVVDLVPSSDWVASHDRYRAISHLGESSAAP